MSSSLERQDSQQTRAHAISALKRSASKRSDGSGRSAPALARTESEQARDEAMRRLEGASPSLSPSSSLSRSGSAYGQRPPRLSAIQRRHVEQQQQQQQAKAMDDASDPDSPSFSIFTPSVLGPLGPAPPPVQPLPVASPATPINEPGERQEARSNLIRKLSQRELKNGRKPSVRDASRHPAAPISPDASPTDTIASEFRPYRYTMERDRDSVYAKLNHEDSFEYDQMLQQAKQERQRAQEHDQEEVVADQHHWPQPSRDYAFPSPASSRPTSPRQPSRAMSPVMGSQPMRKINSESSATQRHQAQRSRRKSSVEDLGRHLPAPSRQRDDHHGTPHSMSRSTLSNEGTPSPKMHSHHQKGSPSTQKSLSSHTSKRSTDRHTPSPTNSVSRQHQHSKSKLSEDHHYDAASSGPLVLHDSDDEQQRAFYDSDEDESPPPQLPKKEPPTGPPPRDAILARLEAVLASASSLKVSSPQQSPQAAASMGDPPRKLVMHAPVLQVVNANTVKDRYLFLFNDMLLIAKPLILEDPATTLIVPPSLDTKFLTKSIVELEKLKLSAQRDDAGLELEEKKKHSLLVSFVDRFANDPKKAIYTLVMKGGLANQPEVIANLLFRTPELNHSQLGVYLSKKDNKYVMKAFIERFRFFGVRLEDSLRCLLATIRLPNDAAAAEYILSVFSTVWTALNGLSLGWDAALTSRLVISTMELNDYLHSGIDDESTAMGHLFGFPNPAITVTDFLGAFRSKDPKGFVSDEVLSRIYLSIKRERLQQASDNSIMAVTPEIPVIITPTRLPSRLTYQTFSEEITVRIPKPDAKFSIRLLGGDMRCEPSVLRFEKSNEARFRISATALGHRTLLFLKSGRNATFYTGLPINKSFSVERAFMKNTFQLSFVNHLGIKRKYMFSMSDAHLCSQWLDALRAGVDSCTAALSYHATHTSRARQVAASVSLQVLRDALIQPDDAKAVNLDSSNPRRPNSGNANKSQSAATARQRSNSFSKTYFVGMGRAETDLNQSTGRAGTPGTGRRPSAPAHASKLSGSQQPQQDEAETEHAKTGHEVALQAIQNSHLPAVLGLLSSSVAAAPHPLSPTSSAFRPTPQPWRPSSAVQ